MEQTPLAKQRIHLMDELRGFAVFCMVFYHRFIPLPICTIWSLARFCFISLCPQNPGSLVCSF